MKNIPSLRFSGFSDEWTEQPLGKIADIVGGGTPSTSVPEYWDGNIDWYAPAEIKDQRFVSDSVRKITELGLQRSSAKILPADKTVLFTSRAGIGKTAILKKPGATNQGFQSLILNDGINPYFIYSKSIEIKEKAEQVASGSTFLEISGKKLGELTTKLPQKSEQDTIAETFERLDDLIIAQQLKYKKLLALRSACLDKMFPRNGSLCPEMRFGGFTDDWKVRMVEDLVADGTIDAPMDGNHGEKHPKASDYVTEGVPFLMASDIHNGQADIYGCQHITQVRALALDKGFAINGDVLLTHKATIGETAILKNLECEFAMLTPQVTYYRVKDASKLDREFLYAFFNSSDFQAELKEKAAQSTRAYIGISAQRTLKILLPQNVIEQAKIGSFFVMLDELISLHDSQLRKLNQFKESMLHNMLV